MSDAMTKPNNFRPIFYYQSFHQSMFVCVYVCMYLSQVGNLVRYPSCTCMYVGTWPDNRLGPLPDLLLGVGWQKELLGLSVLKVIQGTESRKIILKGLFRPV